MNRKTLIIGGVIILIFVFAFLGFYFHNEINNYIENESWIYSKPKKPTIPTIMINNKIISPLCFDFLIFFATFFTFFTVFLLLAINPPLVKL